MSLRFLIDPRGYPSGGAVNDPLTLRNIATREVGWGTFFPPPPTANLKVWLKSDAGVFSDAGVTPAVPDGLVQQWNDQSGNGNHLTQTTVLSQPLFKTNIFNGKPVLRFDGIDDWLYSGSFGPFSPPNTVFIVFNFASGFFILDNVTSPNRGCTFGLNILVGGSISITADGGASGLNFVRSEPTGPVLYEVVINDPTSEMWQNGALVASGAAGGQSIDDLSIAHSATLFSSMDVAEILVYSGLLSVGDQAIVNNSLNAKYNLY